MSLYDDLRRMREEGMIVKTSVFDIKPMSSLRDPLPLDRFRGETELEEQVRDTVVSYLSTRMVSYIVDPKDSSVETCTEQIDAEIQRSLDFLAYLQMRRMRRDAAAREKYVTTSQSFVDTYLADLSPVEQRRLLYGEFNYVDISAT